MFSVLKKLKLWQVVVLLLVVFGIPGAVYGTYGQAAGSTSTSALPANSRLVRVQYGNLTNSVSASGSLVFATTEDLTFGSAGTVREVNVQVNDAVEKGDVVATLDDASILSLQEAVASARVDLANAQNALDKAQNPYTESQIAEANAAVQQAQQQLADAQALGPLDVADAEYAATQAEQNYSDSIRSFMNNRITVDDLNKAERDWERAEVNVQTVQTNADKSVIDAQNNLATAESALGNMTVDPLDVALKQVQVQSAQSALDEVLARLGNTTLVAPFDGIVAAVNVQAGQSVNAGTVAVQIADPSDIEVSTSVDEIDVPQVKQGQKATISLDALPNDEFSGIVSSISSFGNVQSGVVSYPVTIELTVPSGVQLREGMSATATIITQEVDNVLLVPAAAISGGSTNPRVRVMVNGVPEVRAVTVGQSNDQYTQIVSGLNAGDEVVVTSTTTSTSSSTSGRGIGIGGFGGGGIINIGR